MINFSDLPVRCCNVRAVDVRHSTRSAVAHDQLQFALQNFEDPIDTWLPESSKSPQEWPAHPNGFGPKCQSLEYICSAAESPIHEDRNAIAGFTDDLGQRLQ